MSAFIMLSRLAGWTFHTSCFIVEPASYRNPQLAVRLTPSSLRRLISGPSVPMLPSPAASPGFSTPAVSVPASVSFPSLTGPFPVFFPIFRSAAPCFSGSVLPIHLVSWAFHPGAKPHRVPATPLRVHPCRPSRTHASITPRRASPACADTGCVT